VKKYWRSCGAIATANDFRHTELGRIRADYEIMSVAQGEAATKTPALDGRDGDLW
jgi:hypothetical protein